VEDRPGGPNVVVVSDGFWRSRLGGSTDVVGHTLSLDGNLFTIIGVLNASFDLDAVVPSLAGRPAVWLPLQMDPNTTSDLNYYFAAGRLRGVSFEAAQAQTARSVDVARRTLPGIMPADKGLGLGIDRLQAAFVRDLRSSLLLLWSVVALVLLIAGANIINLLLLRASVREREIAIRVATGASRGRIVRQLVTEGIVLALAGGGVGLALGAAGTRVLLSLEGWTLPHVGSNGPGVTVNLHVLFLTLITSVATGIVFGLVPAYRASRIDLDVALKAGSRGDSDVGHYNVRGLLVVSEVALALMLLVGSALLIRSFVALRQVDPGFDSHDVLTMQTAMIGRRFASVGAVADMVKVGLQRLNALPGIEVAASTFTGVPFEPCCPLNVSIVGRLETRRYSTRSTEPRVAGLLRCPEDSAGVAALRIATMQVPTPVALINLPWRGDTGPMPTRCAMRSCRPEDRWRVEEPFAAHRRHRHSIRARYEPRANHEPLWQMSERQAALFNRQGKSMSWIIRTRGEPHLMAGAVQKEIRAAGAGLPAARIRSMDDVSATSTARDKFEMWLVAIFGAVALLLAAVGLYGVMSYSVQQRRREIGIRMALGAEAEQLRRMVLIQAMQMTSIGVVVGLVCALGLTRFMAGLLFGVGQYDGTSFVTVPLVLCAVALAAAWLPARRASSVEPMVALRAE
jgi:cell division protein FtsX